MPTEKSIDPTSDATSSEQPAAAPSVAALRAKQARLLPAVALSHLRSQKLHHQRLQVWLIIVAILVSLGTVVFAAYKSDSALGPVSLSSIKVPPTATTNELGRQLVQQTNSYRFEIIDPLGKSKTYRLADAGLSVNVDKSLTELSRTKQELGWWRFAWWRPTHVNVVIDKDDTKFASFVASQIAVANQPASDASLSIVSGKPVINPGTGGWTYAVAGGNDRIIEAAETLTPLTVSLMKTGVKPSIEGKDLISAQAQAAKLLDHTVTLTLEGKTYTAGPKEIGSWLDIQHVPDQKTADVTVNSGKILAYLDRVTKNDTYPPRSEITTTDDAGVKTILVSGRNGVEITNKSKVASTLSTQLVQKEHAIRAELTAAYKQHRTINAADYPKWIVVDLTTKRMYAYEHTNLIRTFLVSAGAPKTPTVTGTYQIYSKYAQKDMRGLNVDGSRYFQPNVKYVSFFYKDYAIHGNYWRPTSYFGNINSSHGCVGITDSDAKWLYDWAPIGTTVITH